jgi:ubiquitin-conjugating enzyme E2 J2
MSHKKQYVVRLQKELQQLLKEPVPHVKAFPNPNNILEWHYVITGPEDSPFRGGTYHGKLKFPPEYPMKPPSILMLTPNGRFKPNTRLCLSMSDFHPETWNPLWSVGSILTGLLSFMLEDKITTGSIETTDLQKRQYAIGSMEFNKRDPMFRKLFPDLVKDYEAAQEARDSSTSTTMTTTTTPNEESGNQQQLGGHSYLDLIFLAFAILVAVFFYVYMQ